MGSHLRKLSYLLHQISAAAELSGIF